MAGWSPSLQNIKRWSFGAVVVAVCFCVFMLTRTDQEIEPNVYRVDWVRGQIVNTTFPTRNTTSFTGANRVRTWYHVTSVHVAVVVCGDRLEESLVLLKSAIIFSRTHLVFHIFTEDKKRQAIITEIESWPSFHRERLKVNLYKIQFPESPSCPECKPDDWKTLFRPCAAQRLFIPDILSDVDSIIYMDTDTLFLSPIEDVWSHFYKFTPHQIFGISPELSGWYLDKTFPYCTKTGANSGVLLMNLTRIRHVKWMIKMNEYFAAYRKYITLGDQDLLNIYCHFYPGQVYEMSCPWNYRGIFCPSESACQEGKLEGAYILHGNSQMFHIDKIPVIREVYLAVIEHNLEKDSLQDLLVRMKRRIQNFSETACGKTPQTFTKHLEKYISTIAQT